MEIRYLNVSVGAEKSYRSRNKILTGALTYVIYLYTYSGDLCRYQ